MSAYVLWRGQAVRLGVCLSFHLSDWLSVYLGGAGNYPILLWPSKYALKQLNSNARAPLQGEQHYPFPCHFCVTLTIVWLCMQPSYFFPNTHPSYMR